MLNSGGKKYSNPRGVRKICSERNKKPYPPPPLQVKWSVPYIYHAITTTAVPFPLT